MIHGVFEALDHYDGHGWVAKGWAFDPERPGEPAELQLWSEEGCLLSFRADRPRADLAAAGIGTGRHAFEALLPAPLLDGRPHLVHIIDAGSRQVLDQSPRTFVLPRFRGRLETVQGLTLEGWARDDLAPDRPPVIDVLVDGRLVTRVAADRFRADLTRSLGTSGHNAFRLTLPIDLCDDAPHRVDLRFTNTDTALEGCPAEVRLSPQAVPAPLRRAHRDWRARRDELDAAQAGMERLSLRPIEDPGTYRRWLAHHEERWQDLKPDAAADGEPPVFTVIAEAADAADTVAPRLAASTPRWELMAAQAPDRLGAALERARGAFVLLVPAGATPHPALLAELRDAVRDGTADAVYVDEDTLAADGTRSAPRFKPDWDPDRCLEDGYVGTAACVRHSVLAQAWRRLEGLAPVAWDAVVETALLALPDHRIRHLPAVLWHRAPDRAPSESIGARAARLRRILAPSVRAEATPAGVRIRRAIPQPPPAVTLIIPTRDRVDLLRTCVDSILGKTRYAPLSLLVVDNGSREAETLAYFETLRGHPSVRVLHRPGPFNFSALNNEAVALADSPLVGLVNNDVEAIAPDWLEDMVAHAVRPDVGAVGAKLLFPDGRIQHGGVVVGFHGVADNVQQGFEGSEPGYLRSAATTQNVSAVTAACLLCRREAYRAVGGLDETDFAVSFNDVDFCLKLRARGLRVVWTPHAVLYHHESASRGADRSAESFRREAAEADRLRAKWTTDRFADPFYSPNLARTGHSHSDFAWPATPKTR